MPKTHHCQCEEGRIRDSLRILVLTWTTYSPPRSLTSASPALELDSFNVKLWLHAIKLERILLSPSSR